MSFQVTTNFVQQFGNTLNALAQQKNSRFENTVQMQSGITGTTYWHEQIGVSSAYPITSRHGDTQLVEIPHARRRVDLGKFAWAELMERLDQVQMLADMTSPYTMAGAMAMNRQKDDIIIAQFFATAFTGVAGATSVAFPAAQQVAVNSWSFGSGSGNAGLTISKLIEAKKILLSGNVDPEEPMFAAYSAVQMANLLATTEVTSADYNSVKALTTGAIDTFLGLKFVHSERLPVDGSGYRRCPVWAKSGMCMAVGKDVNFDIGPRRDKNNAMQAYFDMYLGASRIEEAKVVEIKCSEA